MGRSHVVAATLLATLVAGSRASQAQIIRPVRVARPAAVTSISAGWMRMPKAIHDGPTNAWWNFGDAAQYRGALEMPVSDAMALGVAITTSRVPIIYASGQPAGCTNGCDANLTMQQAIGTLHLGAGSGGFQEVLDLGVGVTRFAGIATTSGVALGDGKAVIDPTFALGYGVGYGIVPRLQLFLTQEIGIIVHKRVAGTPSNTAQQQTTRIGLRFALGSR